MRKIMVAMGLAALVLTGCAGSREPEVPPLTLDGEGIQPTVSGLRIDFGRAQTGVIDTVSRLLEEDPVEIVTQAECGAGLVTAVRWEEGLTLNFQDGAFAGWVTGDASLPVAGGFFPGQPRVNMPQVSFQVTTLGNEFARGPIAGILDPTDTQIALLWAGTTCFFR